MSRLWGRFQGAVCRAHRRLEVEEECAGGEERYRRESMNVSCGCARRRGARGARGCGGSDGLGSLFSRTVIAEMRTTAALGGTGVVAEADSKVVLGWTRVCSAQAKRAQRSAS
jgi:hypothetical protein